MSDIRVRWAPSNTGPDVHIGNVRTVLFNHLFAKKVGGRTIFRIEDSDLARSKPEYADAIANTLDWLGLRADEGYKIGGDLGPYTQTEKLARYKTVADMLIEQGHAYRCYCSQEEMTALRNQLPEKERGFFRYPGICRDRKDWPKDKDYVVRLKAPTEGSIEWDDLVFGKMSIPNVENYDWVLMRSDGSVMYNWSCCLDDHDQKITHVIRGKDHIPNTPIQMMLHKLLGSQPIQYCHLPMMLAPGPGAKKLSKRDATVSITDYRNAGYTPSGILNYLCRFGWGHKDQEIFTMVDLIDKFSFDGCGKNDGKFDPKKFASIQYEHLKRNELVSIEEYAVRVMPFLLSHGLANIDPAKLAAAIPILRHKCKTLVEAANELDPILRPTIAIDPIASEKFLTPANKTHLQNLATNLKQVDNWSEETLRAATTTWLDRNGLTLKDMQQPVRVASVGRTTGPELFQTLCVLGKDIAIERLSVA